jgi:hypothetical protein
MLLFCISVNKNWTMTEFIELIKILLPALVILAVVYIMLREFTKQNTKQFNYLRDQQELQKITLKRESKSKNDKISIPLKFQAYERMALFLERINPTNLLTRVLKTKSRVGALHSSLLSTVRDEYEHNMSQQLYISNNSWEMIKAAKEDVVRLINTAASKFNSDDDAAGFAQEIITNGFTNQANPIEKALKELKEDIRQNFD